MKTVDIYYRKASRGKPTALVSVPLAEEFHGRPWEDILRAASIMAGIDFLSRRDKGAFEIQTDLGVWSRHDDSEGVLTANTARFIAWEEM